MSASFRKGSLYVSPWIQCRHRGKINIQKPRPSHLERRIFEAITAPIIPIQLKDPTKICTQQSMARRREIEQRKRGLGEDVNEYEEFLIKNIRGLFEKNQMVAIYQHISMTQEQLKTVKNKLLPKGLQMRKFGNKIIKTSLAGSSWANLKPLFYGYNMMVVAETPLVSELIKITNKIPEISLIGGVVDDTILSRDGMLRYAQLPELPALRGELVGTLSAAAAKTHSLLGHHQQMLSQSLQQYVHDQNDDQPPS